MELLSADLEKHRLELVGSTETRLHESVEVLHIPSYKFVLRRDHEQSRTRGLNHGGIALYSRNGSILETHLEHSVVFEGSLHIFACEQIDTHMFHNGKQFSHECIHAANPICVC